MPTYRPPYVGLQYSEALTDAYVHTPSDDPVLVTLELHHTGWATPVRVVNDWTALSATLEADAPNDPATEVEFSGIPFAFSRPAETDSGAPSAVTITVDNLSQIITQMIMDVQESEEPIQVYIRTYLRTDTSAPHELPVVKMWVQSPVQITSSSAQLSCSFGDLTNRRFPRLLWRRMTQTIPLAEQSTLWDVDTDFTLSGGDRIATGASLFDSLHVRTANARSTGLWEVQFSVGLSGTDDCDCFIGVSADSLGAAVSGVRWTRGSGSTGGSGSAAPAGFVNGCTVTLRLNLTAGTGTILVNNVSQGGITWTPGTVCVACQLDNDSVSHIFTLLATTTYPPASGYTVGF